MPEEAKQIPPEIIITDAPGIFKTYSNHINVIWNSFDVRLSFGDSTAVVDQSGKVHVETKAVVTVSWTEAKQIAEIMAQVIRRFEEANGPIKRVEELRTT